jgi:hypothetical protein
MPRIWSSGTPGSAPAEPRVAGGAAPALDAKLSIRRRQLNHAVLYRRPNGLVNAPGSQVNATGLVNSVSIQEVEELARREEECAEVAASLKQLFVTRHLVALRSFLFQLGADW